MVSSKQEFLEKVAVLLGIGVIFVNDNTPVPPGQVDTVIALVKRDNCTEDRSSLPTGRLPTLKQVYGCVAYWGPPKAA